MTTVWMAPIKADRENFKNFVSSLWEYSTTNVQYGSAKRDGERVARRNYSKRNSILSTHSNNENSPLH